MSSLLKEEIQQKRPFTSLESEAFLNMLRTTHFLSQANARFMKGFGLTPTQYNALRILRGANPDSLPCAEVGERMVTPVPDVTRLLDRLETKGLVSRGRDSVDRRVVNVSITDLGLELLDAIDQPALEWTTELFSDFEDEQLRFLIEMLEKARSSPVCS